MSVLLLVPLCAVARAPPPSLSCFERAKVSFHPGRAIEPVDTQMNEFSHPVLLFFSLRKMVDTHTGHPKKKAAKSTTSTTVNGSIAPMPSPRGGGMVAR
jgi:hypothetical protein